MMYFGDMSICNIQVRMSPSKLRVLTEPIICIQLTARLEFASVTPIMPGIMGTFQCAMTRSQAWTTF